MSICKTSNIKKNFHTGEIITPLQDISLEVNPGDFILIKGESGYGKSTLLYILGALMTFDEGTYYFEGTDISSLSDKEISELRAKKIGFLMQNTNLVQALTLKENAELSLRISGVSTDGASALIERLGLSEYKNHLPHQLSGGQRRRVAAIRSLVHNPQLILADEPTNDLDEHWAIENTKLLKDQCEKGAGVVMATHSKEYDHLASHIFRLQNGVLVSE